jgi:hypothetical protein
VKNGRRGGLAKVAQIGLWRQTRAQPGKKLKTQGFSVDLTQSLSFARS